MTEAAVSSPLMEQYEGAKSRYPGHLVLIRVGDFYESFGDDAKLLAKELEITLTARSPDTAGDRMPMAGVPHHAVDGYLGRLIRKGYKVAVCDQVEDARLAKGLVRREVTRVVTPGTVLDDRILGGPDHNFLAMIALPPAGAAEFAVVDVTTGEWFRGSAPYDGVDGAMAALAPFGPREILFTPSDESRLGRSLRTGLAAEFRGSHIEGAPPALAESDAPVAIGPNPGEAGLRLAAYLRTAQPRLLSLLAPVDGFGTVRRLRLDAKTLRHLEIARPMNPDDPEGPTLLSAWDETATASGRRTLAFWLKQPLADVPAIAARQDVVAWLIERGAALERWQRELRGVGDLARIASRLVGRRLRPPELGALQDGLGKVAQLRSRCLAEPDRPRLLERLLPALEPPAALTDLLARAVPEALPATAESDGPLFRAGFAAAVDRARIAEADGLAELAALERAEQDASGIRSLKVGYNQVFGYYFDVSKPNLAKVLPHFRRKQTLAGGERFTSDRLQELETKILAARTEAVDAERAAWEEFLTAVETHVPAIHRLARAVGELDALMAFASVAQGRGHVRPVVDEGTELVIREGRHPVLDRTLAGRFVPNDTDLDAERSRLLVLTGPNMSGKSTYMRQVGLLVVLAQAGAFVPAKFARVGLVTGLATRMGFTDEIGRGKSSFMVEMSEVAEILASADARSLVLLDEVGRGTSTFDGLSIAWATLRYLHDRIRCRTLLATHYHQLTELVERLPSATNAHLAVRDGPDGIVFLHRLVPGSTDRSYGIHVAKLAGLPPELVAEAERLLKKLESEGVELGGPARRIAPTRYTQAMLLPTETAAPPSDPIVNELRALDPDRMTPVEALAWIHERRRRLPPADRGPA
ncbi:MAG: DNA mismatch repair protein MutS [Thermoplasmata archaeon]|nr:DNA mismatch repair protein MutS [Thermoplasmata archaeon]